MPQWSDDTEDFTLATARAGAVGWAWVPEEGRPEDPLHGAQPGDAVRVAEPPPFLIVDFEIASILLIGWPGRLLRLRVVEPASAADQPLAWASYVRALEVEVETEESPGLLFGPHGEALMPVLDAAAAFDRAAAERLAEGLDPEASAAADRAWRAWMEERGESSERYEDLSATLLSGGDRPGSPVGRGLMLIANTVHKRAVAVDGDSATESDEEDVWLVPPWNRAAAALCDAAIALGAPHLVGEEDRKILLRAWERMSG